MSEKDNSGFIERFTVRFPDGMRDVIAERARNNGRSMNSEIVQILEDVIASDERRKQGLDLTGVSEEQMNYIIDTMTKKLVDKMGEVMAAENKKPT